MTNAELEQTKTGANAILDAAPSLGCKISECTDVVFLRQAVEALWTIIDDIDTCSDMAKGNDKVYRQFVERRQAERWADTSIRSDGYNIYRAK